MKGLALLGISCLVFFSGCKPRGYNEDSGDIETWSVRNNVWDRAMEEQFSEWIQAIGNARENKQCIMLGDCLKKASVNPLHDSRDNSLDVFADCADVPMILRAYFAYKKQLPFSVSIVSGAQYTAGNRPTGGEKNQTEFAEGSVRSLFTSIANTVQSGYYRTAPDVEGTDTFPAEISKKSIRPGTVFYDPNGHVLLVYRVDSDGTVRLMDGHPDNSLTIQRFGEKFARGGKGQGGGFRNWRLTELQGGRIVRKPNAAHPGYYGGANQYVSSDNWGGAGNYYKWIRKVLSGGSKVNIKSEYTDRLAQLCTDINDRIDSVNEAVAAGIPKKEQAWPSDNIYGTTGDWETYATPSRDARLKASFREIHTFIQEATVAFGRSGSEFDFAGFGSRNEMLSFFSDEWNKAMSRSGYSFRYKSSSGETRNFDLNYAMNRLFDLSFDPYQCIELRWGAKPGVSGYDAAACDKDGKLKRYNEESGWRNRIERNYDEKTSLSGGDSTVPSIHIPKLIAQLAGGDLPPPVVNPTATPAPVAFPKGCKVQSPDNIANTRKGPGGANPVVKVLNNGASVKAIRANGNWYSVEFRLGGVDYGEAMNNPAWIHSSLLRCN